MRTPKPFRAPSPLSHRNTSLPSGLGRMASTTRLLSFDIVPGSLVAAPARIASDPNVFPSCFHGPEFRAGEAWGKQQGSNSRNVEERPEPNYASENFVMSTFRNEQECRGSMRNKYVLTLPRLESGVRIPSPAPMFTITQDTAS